MFIRRNMSSNVSYQQLKQYPCFKQLAKQNDVLILKEILPMVVKKVSLDVAKQSFNPQKMMYIPEQNNQGVESGYAIDATVKQIKDSSKLRFLMIETKIYNILKYVFHKKIQCMDHLKNFQKLNFMYRSHLDEVAYGGYIYRKDDPIKSLYYLVRGTINLSKCIDQKQINICNIHQGTFFGVYQFKKSKIVRILNAQSVSNDTIVLKITLDMLTQLFGKDQDEVYRKIIGLPSQIVKIRLEQNKKLIKSDKYDKKTNFIKAYEFQRRLVKFTQTRNIKKSQTAFGRFIQNKSLLFKIKDSNDSLKRQQKVSQIRLSNFHKNQQTSKYYNRLNQHRLSNLGNNIGNNTLIKFFNKEKQNCGSKIDNEGEKKNDCILTSRLKEKFNLSKIYFESKDG